MAGWDQRGSPNTNRFYRAEELSPEQWSQLQARMHAPEVRAEIEAIQDASHQRRLAASRRGRRIPVTLNEDQQAFADVYQRHGIVIPNGYNVSPQTGEIQFADSTPFLQQLLRTAPVTVPIIGAQLAPLMAGAQVAGAGSQVAGASTTGLPFLNPAGAAIPAAWGGPAVGATATKAAGAASLGRKALGWLDTDEASALGKVGAWAADEYGERRAEDIREADKTVWDQRYQDALDLSAQQRTEDLQLDADREAALQARWDAEQLRLKTVWEARETRMEPYREVGRQTLASLSNMQTPTRERYRSRYMG